MVFQPAVPSGSTLVVLGERDFGGQRRALRIAGREGLQILGRDSLHAGTGRR